MARAEIREIERGMETSETGGARRSARLGKRVGDWRAAEARANSRFPNRLVRLRRSREPGSQLNRSDFFFSLTHPLTNLRTC
jgi:hypothetical protein